MCAHGMIVWAARKISVAKLNPLMILVLVLGRPSLRNVLTVILGYVLSECVKNPADVQYLL